MKKQDIRIGGTYEARVSGRVTRVRITSENVNGGWNAVNNATQREIRIRTAARLRKPVRIGIEPWDSFVSLYLATR